MPDYDENPDHPGENFGDGDQNQHPPPPPPPVEPAAAPQQHHPGPQPQNPGPERGEEEEEDEEDEEEEEEEEDDEEEEEDVEEESSINDSDDSAIIIDAENPNPEEIDAWFQEFGGQAMLDRLAARIAELVQGSFDNDADFLAQYNNFLLGGAMPPGLVALVEAVQDRVQLGMAAEDIQAIPGRTFEAPKCSICGVVFLEADLVRQLPSCRHEFHSFCLVDALVKTSGADCPKCGQEILFN